MAKNSNLTAAKKAKNDEFYTQISDIEKELIHYWDKLKGKIVFCNCDDPAESNFWRYFHLNFSRIGLKKLIATHYDPERPTYKLEYEGGDDSDWSKGVLTSLRGNGDFRSPECVELLKECDVVVTNPPFSLSRSFITQLIAYDKQFIVISNMNDIKCKDIFPLLRDNKMWIGYTNPKIFVQPDGTLKQFGNLLWHTNIDIRKRHEPLTLFRRYSDDLEMYPTYDNYDAIDVGRVSDIPEDYFGIMGVPISYLQQHCPDQFEIVGISSSLDFFKPTVKYDSPLRHNLDGTTTRQHIAVNQTVTLGHDTPPVGKLYCTANNTEKYLTSPYNRIFIKRKLQI